MSKGYQATGDGLSFQGLALSPFFTFYYFCLFTFIFIYNELKTKIW
jgi:hypothetical protein